MSARKNTRKQEQRDYDAKPGETDREWYARRAREWRELGPDGWLKQREASFLTAIASIK